MRQIVNDRHHTFLLLAVVTVITAPFPVEATHVQIKKTVAGSGILLAEVSLMVTTKSK